MLRLELYVRIGTKKDPLAKNRVITYQNTNFFKKV